MRRVAIVGAGIGAEHLKGYLALPERFQVLWVCDLDQARAKAIAAPHGISVTTDMSMVLQDERVDIIDICLPPHLHFQACVSALDAGKHVICEKPLVTSLADADALAAKAKTSRGSVFPVFQYRYGLGSAQLSALIEAGLAGRCFAGSLETHWDRDAAYYAVPWRGTWTGEQGGALLGHAIHIHDLFQVFTGPVAQVFAQAATRVNAVEVEDCAALTLKTEDGAVISSSVTLGAAGNMSRLRLMFEGFTVESDHAPYTLAEKAWRFVARAPRDQGEIDAVLNTVPAQPSGFEGFFAAIGDALDGKKGREVTLEAGRKSLEFVTAAYFSARAGVPVNLPLGPDHPLYGGWVPKR